MRIGRVQRNLVAACAGAVLLAVGLAGPASASPTYLDNANFQELSVAIANSQTVYIPGACIDAKNEIFTLVSIPVLADTSSLCFDSGHTYLTFERQVWSSGSPVTTESTLDGFNGTVGYSRLVTGAGAVRFQTAALARLGKPTATFQTSVNTEGAWLADLMPNGIGQRVVAYGFPGALLSAFVLSVGADESVNSTVTRLAGTDAGTYDYFIGIVPGASSTFTNKQIVFTVDAASHLVRKVVQTTANGGDLETRQFVYSLDQASPGFWDSRTLPSGAVTVDHEVLLRMSRRISAEAVAAPKARSIATKATALSPVNGVTAARIRQATTALSPTGVRISYVTGGVKLTATYEGVAGSQCVRAVRGRAVRGYC
jgi:hypothetical protein